MPSDNRVLLDNSSGADDGTLPDVNARVQVGRGVDRDGPREIPGEPLGQLDAGVVRSDGDDGAVDPKLVDRPARRPAPNGHAQHLRTPAPRVVIERPGDIERSQRAQGSDDDLGMTTRADDPDQPHEPLPSDPRNGTTVTSPRPEMPSRRRTLTRVIVRILASSLNDQWSTYQVSSRNFSSQSIAFRPLTCAQPVIPGRTSWRLACSGVYRARYCISSGRGPMRLKSPLSTFQSWGSSSRLVLRRNRPSRVSRSESGSG